MSEPLLVVQSVEKEYPNFKLGPISLTLAANETIALLGQNGAGKSTLFQLLTGSMDPTTGELYLSGRKLNPEAFELKRLLGYLPQNFDLPRWVNGLDILRYSAALHGIDHPEDQVQKTLRYWDSQDFAQRPLAACSHGMQKRIGLALAMLHDPELLILDEPFSGLDLFHIKALDDAIKDRAGRGKATILSTHVAPYAARLCTRALIIERGLLREFTNWPKTSYLDRVTMVEQHFFGHQSQG